MIIAPKWIPDKEADTCMRCQSAKFNMVNRRVILFRFFPIFFNYNLTHLKCLAKKHHCRNCGYVVCGECSKNKYLIASQSDEPLRVCNTCYSSLMSGVPSDNSKSIHNSVNTDSSDESDDEQNGVAQVAASSLEDENSVTFIFIIF
jgi:hypothetical protein